MEVNVTKRKININFPDDDISFTEDKFEDKPVNLKVNK